MATIATRPEATLTHQLLPGCPCGSPHPIALRATDPTICPQCLMPVQPPGAPVTTRAVVQGVPVGRLALWIGEKLAAVAARLRRN